MTEFFHRFYFAIKVAAMTFCLSGAQMQQVLDALKAAKFDKPKGRV